jgi:hypothetical protein
MPHQTKLLHIQQRILRHGDTDMVGISYSYRRYGIQSMVWDKVG